MGLSTISSASAGTQQVHGVLLSQAASSTLQVIPTVGEKWEIIRQVSYYQVTGAGGYTGWDSACKAGLTDGTSFLNEGAPGGGQLAQTYQNDRLMSIPVIVSSTTLWMYFYSSSPYTAFYVGRKV